MADHRYILEPYKGMGTRYTCPSCNKHRKFARYIDKETNDHLGDLVGKCERSDNCSYHYTPKQHFAENGITVEPLTFIKTPEPIKPMSVIPNVLAEKTQKDFEHNHLATYLSTLFDAITTEALIKQYKIGTSKHWPGSTVFWQIDQSGAIRTGKIMQYDPMTGKRVKEPFEKIQWVHKVIKEKDFNLKQCLFGEHLLVDNKLPVAVVESEKTAIIAAGYLPQFTWVAAGNKQGLSVDKCNVLKQLAKTVILYPDLNAFKDWAGKAKLYGFKTSDLLEKKATEDERGNGLDLADYLVRFDVKDFLSKEPAPQQQVILPVPLIETKSETDTTQNLTKPDIEPETLPLSDKSDSPMRLTKVDIQTGIAADLLELQQYYHGLEESGLIPDHHKKYIGTLWQGVMLYKHHPPSLQLYTDPLKQIKTEIETLKIQKTAI
jgi:hypothetical protein